MGNSVYQEKKKELAINHISSMRSKYSVEIADSIALTEYFNKKEVEENKIPCNVVDGDVVDIILKELKGNKVCVLNPSYSKVPCEKFFNGDEVDGSVQESLYMYSTLPNVFEVMKSSEFYENFETNFNKGLYTNKALYTPNVIFVKDEKVRECDVLTCPIPTKEGYVERCKVSADEIAEALRERISYILDTASSYLLDTLIIGSFGNGLCSLNPEDIARVFRGLLKENKYSIKRVVFAINKKKDPISYNAFKDVFDMGW